VLRLLSRIMTAITIPRQIDFTGNFLPPESLGTKASKILDPLYVRDFTGTTKISVPNPISRVVKVLLCTKLQQSIARFLVLGKIIHRLKPLVYKDFVSNLYSHDQ
ncbi:MAG: hypothetical protein QNJ70_21060, partial [Xenococcaceae cyanobacterium MO_207.B15]|nr:hypothetical protein [Xenococcaceae cyanobacterium MO_207.B15]